MTKLNLANHTPNSENVGIRVDAKSILRRLKNVTICCVSNLIMSNVFFSVVLLYDEQTGL